METFEDFVKRRKDNLIRMKDVGRKGFYIFKREAATYMQQHDLKEKYYVIERLRLVKIEGIITHSDNEIGRIEYRIGYYIVGRIGRGNNRWMWGQFCPMIPQQDLMKLIDKAKKEHTII